MEKEKIAQAIEILRELDIDLWMVIDRESGLLTDPVMDFVVGEGATWLSFFLFFKNGEKVRHRRQPGYRKIPPHRPF